MHADSNLLAFVRGLPKAELHVHLEGSISPQLAVVLARRNAVALPGLCQSAKCSAQADIDGVRQAYAVRGFSEFLALYLQLSRCLVTIDDIREVVIDLARQHAGQGVRYAEVTFTPLTHRARGVSCDTLWTGLAQGRDEALRLHGVELRWVFDVVRSLPDTAEATVDFALGMQARDPQSVVGLGVGGPEGDQYPMGAIVHAFARGRAYGFKSLPHAGENAGARSIWLAVRELGADRIGHGVRCLEDPALLEHLATHAIALEVCPTSNVALGVTPSWAEHPLPELLKHGVPVTLASDDPALFGTDVVQEYVHGAKTFSWSREQLRTFAASSIHLSFAEDARKQTWFAELNASSSS